jgi:hypothetical protein
VSVPYAASLNPASFSVEVWANPGGGAGTYRGVVASRAYPQGWVLYAGAGNAWEFWVNSGSGMLLVTGGSVVLNAWTHLVGTLAMSRRRALPLTSVLGIGVAVGGLLLANQRASSGPARAAPGGFAGPATPGGPADGGARATVAAVARADRAAARERWRRTDPGRMRRPGRSRPKKRCGSSPGPTVRARCAGSG